MPLDTAKFIIPDGPPVGGVQKVKSATWGEITGILTGVNVAIPDVDADEPGSLLASDAAGTWAMAPPQRVIAWQQANAVQTAISDGSFVDAELVLAAFGTPHNFTVSGNEITYVGTADIDIVIVTNVTLDKVSGGLASDYTLSALQNGVATPVQQQVSIGSDNITSSITSIVSVETNDVITVGLRGDGNTAAVIVVNTSIIVFGAG